MSSQDTPRDDEAAPDGHDEAASQPLDDDAKRYAREGLTPDQAKAAAVADAMIARREHPEFETASLKRPQTVLIGAIMAWIGALRLIYAAYVLLQVDENSALIDETVSAAQKEIDVQSYHGLGIVLIGWSLTLIVLAWMAFSGQRWAATLLVTMAAVAVLFGVLSSFTAFSVQAIITAIWSASSATLLRYREPSKDWYRALRDAKRG